MPNIRLVTFSGETVTPVDDALVYQTAISDSGIIYGATVTLSGTNTLHVAAGYGIASGRFFEIYDADIIVPLSSSGTLNGQLYVHMDLSSSLSPIDILYETASSLTPMQQDSNVNITNGIYEIQLATFKISTTTISGLAYTAPIVSGAGAGLIGEAENSNRASKAYAVGDLMIWNNKLWKVTTAIAQGGTITVSKLSASNVITEIKSINTKMGGFSFGFTTDNKPGFLAPGADSVIPFSGVDLIDEFDLRINYGQQVVLAQNVNFSDYDWIAVRIYHANEVGNWWPLTYLRYILPGGYSYQFSTYCNFDGQDPRNAPGYFGMFMPCPTNVVGNLEMFCTSITGDYSQVGHYEIFGIRGGGTT